MREYWSNSEFADWVRGTKKPNYASSSEWTRWETEASKKHPIRYWIAEELFSFVQNVVYSPFEFANNIRYYINNRWVSKSHALTAHPRDIKPGNWCDLGNRFLPCLFNELVDFVEIEQAWHHVLWSDEAKTKFETPWYRRGWLRWRTWRCPEAGIEYLEWASNLTGASAGMLPSHKDYNKPTYQAKAAKEILELYYWWKEEYPNRPDPLDASGWSAYCNLRRERNGGKFSVFDNTGETEEERKMGQQALRLSDKIEKEYEKENERMLIRLIKIRQSLWT